uniref:Uncharacterized protein n=1 Tax=Strigamia maritima TaxID=126957 RepID=T1IKH8_STRMM
DGIVHHILNTIGDTHWCIEQSLGKGSSQWEFLAMCWKRSLETCLGLGITFQNVYEKYKDGSGFSVAQSGDATCNGLFSAWEGSKTMSLKRATSPLPRCLFPSWLTHGHHWHSLDGRRVFTFVHRNNSFRLVDQAGAVSDTRAMCIEEVSFDSKRISSGYACYSFTKRWAHVVEVQSASVPDRKRCPYVGQYLIPGAPFKKRLSRRDLCDSYSTVKVGCDATDTIEFRYECTTQHHVQAFHCHGNWDENGTSYLITSLKGTKSKYCFIYTQTDNIVKFSSVRDSCPRNIQPDQCHQNDGDMSSSASSSSFPCLCVCLTLLASTAILSTLNIFQR